MVDRTRVTKTKNQYSASLIVTIAELEEQMIKNLHGCLYAQREVYKPSLRKRIISFFKEAKNRLSNACDCLVKGVDPYDRY